MGIGNLVLLGTDQIAPAEAAGMGLKHVEMHLYHDVVETCGRA